MRTTLISAAFAVCLITPALAQTGSAPAYPPQPYPGYQPQGYQPQGYQPQGYPPPGYQPQGSQPPSYQPPGYEQSGAPGMPQPAPGTGQPMPPGSQGGPTNSQYRPPGENPQSNNASNIDRQNTSTDVAPNLPSPELGPNAGPVDYLRAAEASLATGRTGEAQQSLEEAQTRLLDRSVPYGQVNTPSSNPAVGYITQALHALAAGDRDGCMRYIETAIRAARPPGR